MHSTSASSNVTARTEEGDVLPEEDLATQLEKAESSHQIFVQAKLDLLRDAVQVGKAGSSDDANKAVDSSLQRLAIGRRLQDSAAEIAMRPNDGKTYAGAPIPIPAYSDILEFVDKAKSKWERRIRQELNSMATEMNVPLTRNRNTPGAPPIDESNVRFIYDENDLWEIVLGTGSTNHAHSLTKVHSWNSIKIELKTASIPEFATNLAELSPSLRHVGADDDDTVFVNKKIAAMESIMASGTTSHLRRMARTGVPHAQRRIVWRRILGIDPNDSIENQQIGSLLDDVEANELITDSLFRLDASMTSNDHNYFVFEDILHDVTLVFSRDSWVFKNAVVCSQQQFDQQPLKSKIGGVFPPCGVVPFRGFVLYVTPLCYLCDTLEPLYAIFRRLYCRYWCRLHTVSSKPGCLLQICRQFECLVQERRPDVFFHMLQLDTPPLRVAMPWIVFAFAGTLEAVEVLHLWDRILGYDSLNPIAILAAAIFDFRAKAVLEAKTSEGVQDVFEDLTRVRVVPLMQWFLSREVHSTSFGSLSGTPLSGPAQHGESKLSGAVRGAWQ